MTPNIGQDLSHVDDDASQLFIPWNTWNRHRNTLSEPLYGLNDCFPVKIVGLVVLIGGISLATRWRGVYCGLCGLGPKF